MMKTTAPEYVSVKNVGKPINVVGINKTQITWFVCRPRAFWVEGGRRMEGPVTTDELLPFDIHPGSPAFLMLLVPKLPRHRRPEALRIVVLESGVAEHTICDIPFR